MKLKNGVRLVSLLLVSFCLSSQFHAGFAADKSRRSPDGKRPLDLFLKIGDTVEVSSPKIGALSNKIVASE